MTAYRKCRIDRVTEYQRNAKYDEPFTKKEMERAVADLPTYKAGDAADLKVKLIKAGGSALIFSLKLVNWVWELETAQRGRRGDR
jgi:hypothetical protein